MHSRDSDRDIKPSNIMLTLDSDVRIIDFGIALVADSEISRIEGIAGSPSYMSPEQVQSIELTNRSDLYSLGAVMYELLNGYAAVFAPAICRNCCIKARGEIFAPFLFVLKIKLSQQLPFSTPRFFRCAGGVLCRGVQIPLRRRVCG